MTFVATNKAPGVYIDEIDVPGPIPGVGTSTAAFIGPARRGPINTPTFLTNWTQFVEAFGVQDPLDPRGPFIIAPPVYATHAVRGFFDNGGATCYFVRVGTAVRASRPLDDRATTPQPTLPTLVVTAKQEGVAGNAISVAVQDATGPLIKAVRKKANLLSAQGTQATLDSPADGADFRPGDRVKIEESTKPGEIATIDTISGVTITFRANLTDTYGSDSTIRIADLKDERTIRLAVAVTTALDIEPGTYVKISQTGVTDEFKVVQSVDQVNKFVTLTTPVSNDFNLGGTTDVNLQTVEFNLVIVTPGKGTETFSNLSMDPRHSRYFGKKVNSQSVDVSRASPSTTAPPNDLPALTTTALPLAGGADDDITQIQAPNYTNAIAALERVDDVNILCVPDRTDEVVQKAMILHCEKMQDRFAVLDPAQNATPNPQPLAAGGIGFQREQVISNKGYAALYYPWIVIPDPIGGPPIKVPPSGHVAGLFARTDNTRGVHKAPANETLRGVLALERTLTDDEQGPLNEIGINVIRSFTGRGIVVWGARTIAPVDRTQWRYVNVRRLLLFIEESIQEGTAFAVFEPNDIPLWAKVKRQVTEFLTRVWRDGALVGATADKAFRVRVDEELNPPAIRALGQLVIEVIVFPTTPAEFVVFRVIQKPGGGSFDEF